MVFGMEKESQNSTHSHHLYYTINMGYKVAECQTINRFREYNFVCISCLGNGLAVRIDLRLRHSYHFPTMSKYKPTGEKWFFSQCYPSSKDQCIQLLDRRPLFPDTLCIFQANIAAGRARNTLTDQFPNKFHSFSATVVLNLLLCRMFGDIFGGYIYPSFYCNHPPFSENPP